MAATNRSKDDLINESTGLYKDNTAGDISAADLRDGIYSIFQPQGICQGRLTLESGVPVSTSDQTAKTNVYFTPYLGNCIGLYDGTSWKLFTFTERTLALGTLTSGKNYDVFLYDNSGTLTLEALAWTDDTTRATSLTTQDGVYVKTGATTRRYLGTFRTASTTTTELVFGGVDSAPRIYLWNAQNRVPVAVRSLDSTDSYTYTTDTFRQKRASSNNQVNIVVGLAGESISLTDHAVTVSAASASRSNGIGYDSTSAQATGCILGRCGGASTAAQEMDAMLDHLPAVGYHYYAILERSDATGTTTWYGDAGVPNLIQSGMTGTWSY